MGQRSCWALEGNAKYWMIESSARLRQARKPSLEQRATRGRAGCHACVEATHWAHGRSQVGSNCDEEGECSSLHCSVARGFVLRSIKARPRSAWNDWAEQHSARLGWIVVSLYSHKLVARSRRCAAEAMSTCCCPDL